MDEVRAALAAHLIAGEVASCAERLDSGLNGAVSLAALFRKRPHRRPTAALIVGAVRQREKDDLLAIGQLCRPHRRHDPDAHAATLSGASAARSLRA